MHGDALSSWIGIAFTALAAASASSQVFWINEFHYDNTGADVGEFVEVVAPADFTDLASVRLTLYNGADGHPYGAAHLLSSFTPGETASGWTVYSKTISGLQNGAPDGLSLDVGGSVVHFLSYEGGFLGSSGPAAGLFAPDIGVSQSESTPVGSSLGLIGTGSSLSDFTWTSFGAASPGYFNAGQAVVPEPGEYALAACLGLGGLAWWRRRRRCVGNPCLPTVSANPSGKECR
ncbi:MAG: hypothetical protein KF833_20560 [Verrucomicrobiae bacterium]|nr:hypothetical protein [Verrucomicrobiae bacterium]